MASRRGQPRPIEIGAKNTAKKVFDDVVTQAKAADTAITGLGKRNPKTLIESLKVLRAELKGLDVTTKQVGRAFQNAEDAGKKLATIGIGTGLVAAGAVKAAADFSTQIAEIATLSVRGSAAQDDLSSSVLRLSNTFGVANSDASRAFYQALSAGAQEGAEANELLDVSAKLAVGGVTELTTAVDTITSVVNAYNKPVSDAANISDLLFTTVRLGKTNMDQLGASIANVTPIASAAGIRFEEVAASIAAITAGGTATTVATTQLRSAIQALAAGGDDLDAIFGQFGGITEVLSGPGGLQQALNLVADATGRDIGALRELLGRAEAVNAVLSLTGPNANRFAAALDGMTNAAGATDTAFETVNESLGRRLSTTITNISNLFVTLGETLAPIAGVLLDITTAVTGFAASFAADNPIVTVGFAAAAALLPLGALLALFGKFGPRILTIVRPLLTLVTGFGGLTAALGAARVASLALLATPIGAFFGAVAAAGVALNVVLNRTSERIAAARKEATETRALVQQLAQLSRDAENQGLNDTRDEALALARRAALTEGSNQEIAESAKILQARVNDVQTLKAQRTEAEQALTKLRADNAKITTENAEKANKKQIEDRIKAEGETLKAINARIKEAETAEADSIRRLEALRTASQSIADELDTNVQEIEPQDITGGLQDGLRLRQEIAQVDSIAAAEAAQAALKKQIDSAKTIEDDKDRLTVLKQLQSLNVALSRETEQLAAAEQAAAEKRKAEDEAAKVAAEDRIATLKTSLADLTTPKVIPVTLDTGDAERRLALLSAQLDVIAERSGSSGSGGRTAAPGVLPGFNQGGAIPGYGGGDKILALLEAGEFVVKKERASMFGGLLRMINGSSLAMAKNLGLPRFQTGGPVGASPAPAPMTPINLTIGQTSFGMQASPDVAAGLREMISIDALRTGRSIRRGY